MWPKIRRWLDDPVTTLFVYGLLAAAAIGELRRPASDGNPDAA